MPSAGTSPWALEPGWPFTLALLGVLAAALALRSLGIRIGGRDRFRSLAGSLERGVLFLLLAILIVFSALQILLRNLFQTGLVWIDPLLRALVLWICFFGAAAATSSGRHIAMDVSSWIFPARYRVWLRRVLSVLAAGICVLFAGGGYEYLRQEREYGGETFLGLASWQVQSILLLGFALLAYRFLVVAIFEPEAEATDDLSRVDPGPQSE